ncbi:MAG: hypothetical protein KDA42_07530 [Planctomycetales bacterium]|nr:hypothetical protein [Planctomycetales bacterium]
MSAERIVWENQEKSRRVEMVLDFVTKSGHLHLSSIRPISVSFYRPGTKSVERTIHVHTETGRRLLRRQYLASCDAQATLDHAIHTQRTLRDELTISMAV